MIDTSTNFHQKFIPLAVQQDSEGWWQNGRWGSHGRDRVAQMVVEQALEPFVEPISTIPLDTGPASALDALGVARQRCSRYDWVLDFDIKSFFRFTTHEAA